MKTKVLLGLPFLLAPVALGGFDADGNGLSDLFEFIHFGGPADPGADPDGDGFTTAEEAVWGTDPTDPSSFPAGAGAHVAGSDLVLSWPAVAGKWYRLQVSADLQTWDAVAEGCIASHREPLTADGRRFWRVQVFALTPDSDGNGFDDWEEALWKSRFGNVPGESDLDGDGLSDAEEFTGGHNLEKKDHPAVGLVVFTPLEK
ncbi:MAG: hypothetical protein HS113_22770 [Verrucomicrobiales bacterium]|nr:hypothetical protein [Verrucomicrobiales bacterium]